jgi:hypothetical protein
VTGFEPATSGATVRRSTAELHPPSSEVHSSQFSVLSCWSIVSWSLVRPWFLIVRLDARLAGSRTWALPDDRSVVYANKNGEAPPSGVAGNVPRLDQ